VSTTYSSAFGRAMAMAANKSRILTIFLEHSYFLDTPFYCNIQHRHSLVWGESDKRLLTQAGISPEHVRVIGAPNQDQSVSTPRHADAARDFRTNARIRFLFLPSRTGGLTVSEPVAERTFRSVAHTILTLPNADLFVKLHPGDHTGMAHRVLGGMPRVTIAQEGSSLDSLAKCDVAIITASTTGLEACALGKPLIIYNMTGMRDVINIASYGAALRATCETEFEEAIRNLLTDPECLESLNKGRLSVVADFLDGSTGNSSRKAALMIEEIIEKGDL
jgi:hypothetical protein